MAIIQLSVFLENKPGKLAETVKRISEAGVNIRAMSLADTKDFGILRLIVSDVAATKSLLTDQAIVIETEVVAVHMDDQAGALYRILKVLDGAQINVEYLYAFTGTKSDSAYVVLRVDNTDAAEKLLAENGVATLSDDELKALL
ncbi:MAG: amino acid-binding protein [Clostridia bacterium]|nr:amino acid-binding protein [Clostridia bacterium]